MRELISIATNRLSSLLDDGDEVQMVEVIIGAAETEYYLTTDRDLARGRRVDTMRFTATRGGIEMVIDALQKRADEMAAGDVAE